MNKSIITTVISLIVFISPLQIFAQVPTSIEEILSGVDASIRPQIEQRIRQMFPDGIPTIEQAQSQIMRDTLEVRITPPTPNPYEKVRIEIVSYLTDLNRAEIFWYVNDKLKKSGIGGKRFDFEVGGSGKLTKIDLVVKTIEGHRMDKQFNFNPVSLDILWEADTYTPPFYKGKALPSAKSWLKIVATPGFVSTSGKKLDESKLIYLWKKDGKLQEDSSGYGKNVLYTEGPIRFGDANIEVSASSLYNTLSSTQKVKIKLDSPQIILYEDRPIQGIWYENAIERILDLSDQELTVRAEPYFFAEDDKKVGNLIYNWSLDGSSIDGEDGKITFRQEGGEGSARVGINIRNIAKTVQSAAASFVLNFKSASLFNF